MKFYAEAVSRCEILCIESVKIIKEGTETAVLALYTVYKNEA